MAYTTIKKPSDYFNTVLYVGNETDNHAITGVGFQPDFVWAKNRTVAESHNLFDSVRGATKLLIPNTTPAESTQATFLKSFDTDGFTLGTSNNINDNGANLVAWNFLASNTTASNTDGSITSTVSANTTSGFSIATYTGNGTGSATIGHGLGSAPKFVIIKNRGRAGENWQTWFDNDKRLNLNSTSVSFISTHPISTSSTVVTTPSTVDSGWNTNNDTYVMYSFAEKQGFSKFGSYEGNGSGDGTFIYTGFKPAWLMIKNADGLNNWSIKDNKRDTYNPELKQLLANSSNVESDDAGLDFLSNGFKLRGTSGNINTGSNTYIYMAFAEEPLVGDNPATAR